MEKVRTFSTRYNYSVVTDDIITEAGGQIVEALNYVTKELNDGSFFWKITNHAYRFDGRGVTYIVELQMRDDVPKDVDPKQFWEDFDADELYVCIEGADFDRLFLDNVMLILEGVTEE